MLIDRQLPVYDVREAHEVEVRATAAELDPLVRTLDLSGSTLIRLLFALRGLPRESLRLARMRRLNFEVLDHAPEEELVLGVIGRFWKLREPPRKFDPAEFARFVEPGYGKAALNFALVPVAEGRTRLRTETRVLCTDDASRRSFLRYWGVIRPFSGWIRVEALRCVKRTAEAGRQLAWPDAPAEASEGWAPGGTRGRTE